MRAKALAAVAILVLLCAMLPAASAFVQAPTAIDTSGASAAFGSITVTAGNLLIVGMRLGGNVTVTVSDTKSNTWTQITGASLQNNADGDSVYLYYAKSAAGGATTVTLTPSGSVSIRANLFEFSGLDTSSPEDQANKNDQAAGTAATSGNITTTQAAEMLVGFASNGSTQTGTYTAGTLGSGTGTIPSGGTSSKTAMMYHAESSTGTYSSTINFSNLNPDVVYGSIASLKDSGGVSSTCNGRLSLLGAGC